MVEQELGENWSVSLNSSYRHALDKINALPIYQSSALYYNKVKNDLVKFRIGVINNTNPNLKTYIHFRAHIDMILVIILVLIGMPQKFMGRGENFYKYQVDLTEMFHLSWTVAAQSKQELIPMYQKLNYLASVCAPDYSKTGYMRGNLITLTVGGYLYEQVGIMTGVQFGVPKESPWEIAIPDGGDISNVGSGTNTIASDFNCQRTTTYYRSIRI